MIQIKVVRVQSVTELPVKMARLQSDGWSVSQRDSIDGSISLFATREVSLCQFFCV